MIQRESQYQRRTEKVPEVMAPWQIRRAEDEKKSRMQREIEEAIALLKSHGIKVV
jgi:hypothetical protein